MAKGILFIIQTSLHQIGTEALDAILAASATCSETSVAFINDGVLQLQKDQKPQVIGLTGSVCAFKVLPLYDINNIYVAETSLKERDLSVNDLAIDVTVTNTPELADIIANHDWVINF